MGLLRGWRKVGARNKTSGIGFDPVPVARAVRDNSPDRWAAKWLYLTMMLGWYNEKIVQVRAKIMRGQERGRTKKLRNKITPYTPVI